MDARTGKLYRNTPFGILVKDGNPNSEDRVYAGLSFRLDSRLLIVEGCVDEDERVAGADVRDCNRSDYDGIAPRLVLLCKLR